MRTRVVLTIATLALLAVPATAAAVTPTDGPYHGVINGTTTNPCGGNEGEGWFRYRSDIDMITKLGSASYCGFGISISTIYAPTNFLCHQFNPQLPAGTRIPVDASNGFSWKGPLPIGPGQANRTVIFRGSWKSNNVVSGITRVKDGSSCDSGPMRWRMKKF